MAIYDGEIALDYAKFIQPLFPETSLAAAADAFRESGHDVLPLFDASGNVTVIQREVVRRALLSSASPYDPIGPLAAQAPVTVAPNQEATSVIQTLAEGEHAYALVVDGNGRYAGLIFGLDLFSHRAHEARPSMVGGLATPFGVYLTNGIVSGGAKGMGLLSAGACLSLLFLISFFGAVGAVALVGQGLHGPTFTDLLVGDISRRDAMLLNLLSSVGFLALVRAIPLAGTHAAEHMVVHALERREPLTYDVVKRMPRVHPRCGTNLAVGSLMFLGLLDLLRFEMGPLIALVATVTLWRRVGAWVQFLFTTKPPTKAQVENAIAAAGELLHRFRNSGRLNPNFWQRLLNTGLPWVLAGGFAVSLAAYGVSWLLGYPIPVY
ncbi:MAG: DUF1385 domain-containing protein [Fimbriimonadales bacterium]